MKVFYWATKALIYKLFCTNFFAYVFETANEGKKQKQKMLEVTIS